MLPKPVMGPLVTAMIAAAVLGLAGCFSAGSEHPSASPGVTTAPGPTTVPPAGASGSPTDSGGSTAPVIVRTVTAADGTEFLTPTRNIGCHIDAGSARCDIADKTWTPPAKPASCKWDWGFGVIVTRTSAGSMTCASDSLLGGAGAEPLPYGHALRAGNVLCTSSSVGMRCENTATGHGFTLSRQAYTLF